LLAHAGAQLIGCVQITMKTAETAHLGMLSVAPARQGDGLGKHLIAAAEAHARAHGAVAMEMTVIKQRPELIAFYERRGYRWFGREAAFPYGDARFGMPKRDDLFFVVLEKALA
jgi:ribosomal protein S18 acetylase RimI-like enzyme